MPGTQPRGTHAFDLGSLSCTSVTQVLVVVNTENDGEEIELAVLSIHPQLISLKSLSLLYHLFFQLPLLQELPLVM